MNARFVRKGIFADDRLVRLHFYACDRRQKFARLEDLRGVDIGIRVENIFAGFERHDHFFERGVARALAYAVDGALDLRGAVHDRHQGICGSHAQIVMAMHRNRDFIDILYVCHHVGDKFTVFRRYGIAHGIGQVDGGCARLDGDLHHLAQESQVAAGCVFGRKFHVVAKAARVGNHFAAGPFYLFAAHFQFIFHVNIAGCQKDVQPRMHRFPDRFPRRIDVLFEGTGKRSDRRMLDDGGNAFDRRKVARRRDGETGFDDVHAQRVELRSHLELFADIHAATGGLFPVAQRRIENFNLLHILPPRKNSFRRGAPPQTPCARFPER